MGGQLQTNTSDDAIAVINWLHRYIDLCVPNLDNESKNYNDLKRKMNDTSDKSTKDQLSVLLALRSFTVSNEASMEYNKVVRLCIDIKKAFSRNTNTYLVGHIQTVFYSFGQSINSGSIHQKLKRNLGLIVEEYFPVDELNIMV